MLKEKPFLTVCIPTYNNEATLEECISSIKEQDYPQENIEIIVVDGGSEDKTIQIAKTHGCIILNNPDRVEEKARPIGIKASKGEYISFIDADNILSSKNYFHLHVEALESFPYIGFCETVFLDARESDDIITKYLSIIGGDDPLSIYLRMHERFSFLTNDWATESLEFIKQTQEYVIFKLIDPLKMPYFGSNGTLYRKDALLSITFDPFIHTDICFRLFQKGYYGAKVFTGIIHKQDGKIKTFIAKKWRRYTRDYKKLQREFFFKIDMIKLIKLVLKCILIFPLIIDSIIGFFRKPSKAWIIHPILTELTFYTSILSILKDKEKIKKWFHL